MKNKYGCTKVNTKFFYKQIEINLCFLNLNKFNLLFDI